ncbi:MAG: hypothetical protein LBL46_00215 [Rickettsiales bacterium]|jgi:hypothetical protein|nr:hypothetical protein [Rickettsiales bacterium]
MKNLLLVFLAVVFAAPAFAADSNWMNPNYKSYDNATAEEKAKWLPVQGCDDPHYLPAKTTTMLNSSDNIAKNSAAECKAVGYGKYQVNGTTDASVRVIYITCGCKTPAAAPAADTHNCQTLTKWSNLKNRCVSEASYPCEPGEEVKYVGSEQSCVKKSAEPAASNPSEWESFSATCKNGGGTPRRIDGPRQTPDCNCGTGKLWNPVRTMCEDSSSPPPAANEEPAEEETDDAAEEAVADEAPAPTAAQAGIVAENPAEKSYLSDFDSLTAAFNARVAEINKANSEERARAKAAEKAAAERQRAAAATPAVATQSKCPSTATVEVVITTPTGKTWESARADAERMCGAQGFDNFEMLGDCAKQNLGSGPSCNARCQCARKS